MKRIMYIERKDGLEGPGRIGWVEFSKSGRSFYYGGKRFEKTKSGYKYNCIEVETGGRYWISGPKKNGMDRLYGGIVEIEEDTRVEYWNKNQAASWVFSSYKIPLVSYHSNYALPPSSILHPTVSSFIPPTTPLRGEHPLPWSSGHSSGSF